ncbi:MAG: hypothetical protein AAF799_07065 [Myxococcota bacterium]
MARLRIGVEQLGAEGLRLEFDAADGATDVLAFGPGGGIRGRLERDAERTGLHGLRADTLLVSELSWGLYQGRLQGTCRLHDVEIEAVMPHDEPKALGSVPFVGVIRARRVEATLSLDLPRAKVQGTTVVLDDFEVNATAEGEVQVRVGHASASTVRIETKTVEVVAQDLSIPEPVHLDGGRLRIESLSVGSVETHLPTFGTPSDDEPERQAEGQPAEPSALPYLDGLDGHVNLDLVADLQVPILGRRKATHRFRVPLQEGIFDYHQLEKSLAGLEDLVLDFELEDDKLILEKDLPLVPFDNLPLLEWPLDAEGMERAKNNRVRLSTFVRPRLSAKLRESAQADDEGSGVEFTQIDLSEIDVSVRVAPFELPAARGRLHFGDAQRPAIETVEIRGEISHRAEGPPPGQLRFDARNMVLSARGLAFGPRQADVEAIEVERVSPLELPFEGLRPRGLQARVQGLTLRKIDIHRQSDGN